MFVGHFIRCIVCKCNVLQVFMIHSVSSGFTAHVMFAQLIIEHTVLTHALGDDEHMCAQCVHVHVCTAQSLKHTGLRWILSDISVLT